LEDDPAKAGVSFFLGTEFQATPKFSLKLEYNNGFHGEIKPEQVFEDSSELTTKSTILPTTYPGDRL